MEIVRAEPAGRGMPLVERLQRLIEGIDAPIAAFACDGLLVGANEVARALLDFHDLDEAGLEQARKTFEKFIEGAQVAAESLSARTATVGAGAKDASTMAFSYAEKNVQASLDYAQSLVHAKDLSEVMRLHREYVQAQMRALAEPGQGR